MSTFLLLIAVNALLIALASLIVSIVRLVQKRSAKISGIVSVISFMVFFSVGLIAATLYPPESKPDKKETVEPEKITPVPSKIFTSISPRNFYAYGNTYTITGYAIEKNEQGKTVVTVEANGFRKLPVKNGQVIIPVWCAFVSGGQEFDARSASANWESVTYVFETSAEPEILIFYPSDKPESKVEIKIAFDAKTAPEPISQLNANAQPESDNAGMLQDEGSPFPVSIGEIGKNDKGKTTVKIPTNILIKERFSEFNNDNIQKALNAAQMILKVKIVVRNKTMEPSEFGSPAGGMIITGTGTGDLVIIFKILSFSFDTTSLPEKIIVYNDQSSVTFDGKTKKRIK